MISSLCSRYLSYSSTPPRQRHKAPRSEVSVRLSLSFISLCLHQSTEIRRGILQLGVWDPETEMFRCFLEVHREAIIFCILLLVRFLADNENHLPTGRLFVPEQIIITVTSVICAGQGHSLCLLHRHFWLRLSDCLCHAGFCGKEERKTAVG